jgi:hypothetical protein
MTASGSDSMESDQCVETILAAVAPPIVPDFNAAEGFGEFRTFRRHQQIAAVRTRRPPEIAFVKVTLGHNGLERHG